MWAGRTKARKRKQENKVAYAQTFALACTVYVLADGGTPPGKLLMWVLSGVMTREEYPIRKPFVDNNAYVRYGVFVRDHESVRNEAFERNKASVRNYTFVRNNAFVRNGIFVRYNEFVRNEAFVRNKAFVRN